MLSDANQPAPEVARRAFVAHGGMLRTSDALRLGIHPRTLYALRDSGEVEAVGRGLFRLTTAQPLTSPDFVAIAILVPRAVISLVSALSHHGLTAQIPHAVDIALPSHARVPQSCHVPLRTYWFSEPAYSTGVEKVPFDGVPVPIYSAEKTIADCFKYRNKVGLDVAIEALRTYREVIKRPNYKALTEYAAINRVQRVMRPYMDAIL